MALLHPITRLRDIKMETPNKPGLYFARVLEDDKWDVFVRVYGNAPFFKAIILELSSLRIITKVGTGCILEWGPEIKTDKQINAGYYK